MSPLQIGVLYNFEFLQKQCFQSEICYWNLAFKWKCIENIDNFLVYLKKFHDCDEDPLNNYDTGNGT